MMLKAQCSIKMELKSEKKNPKTDCYWYPFSYYFAFVWLCGCLEVFVLQARENQTIKKYPCAIPSGGGLYSFRRIESQLMVDMLLQRGQEFNLPVGISETAWWGQM